MIGKAGLVTIQRSLALSMLGKSGRVCQFKRLETFRGHKLQKPKTHSQNHNPASNPPPFVFEKFLVKKFWKK